MAQFLKNYYSKLNKWQQGAYTCYGVFFMSVFFTAATYKWFYSPGPYGSPPTYWNVLIRNWMTIFSGVIGIYCFFKSDFRKNDWGLMVLTPLVVFTKGFILWFFITPTWQEILK